MPIFTILPGQSMATVAVAHILRTVAFEVLSDALILVPTRRFGGLLRQEFVKQGAKKLPRIVALAEAEEIAPCLLQSKNPAMPEWLRLSLLTKQVMAFERRRIGAVRMEHALALAQALAQLQDLCALHDVRLSTNIFDRLAEGDDAAHWHHTLEFLSILSKHWPAIEEAHEMTIAAWRQTRALNAMTDAWRAASPTHPVFVIGSTASHPPTAALMQVVAAAPNGTVVLPGLDPHITPQEWEAIAAGHPYYHMKRFLTQCGIALESVRPISPTGQKNLWLSALTPTSYVAQWRAMPSMAASDFAHLRCVECATDEEEVRVVSLLMRELPAHQRVALITPDESFMARVAAQLQRFRIVADRLSQGTLSTTENGSLWLALAAAMNEPQRMLAQLTLLRHPSVKINWQGWLDNAEPYFRGLNIHTAGRMPKMPKALRTGDSYQCVALLMQRIAELSRMQLTTSQWIAHGRELLEILQVGAGEKTIDDALESLALTDAMGPMRVESFAAMLHQALCAPCRGEIKEATNIVMLTPVEARLQQFDRVILANMRDDLWPGAPQPGPWLNFHHQQQLGLPDPAEAASLMAHDVLMLGSIIPSSSAPSASVFLTYARRDDGAPVVRSRFIERLVALLAVHGFEESLIHASHYLERARALDKAEAYRPTEPAMPKPTASERAQTYSVSMLDYLCDDPYRIYVRHILRLQESKSFDEMPEARDFGMIAHACVEQLTQHWNTHQRLATDVELQDIADAGLRAFSDHPNIRLFWHKRLYRALAFVNAQEEIRRGHIATVIPEMPVEGTIPLGVASITLKGRIDRLEVDRLAGNVTIVDYKTGVAHSASAMRQGKAVQLLAYALLLESSHEGASPFIPKKGATDVAYWNLPAAKREGRISGLDAKAIQDNELLEKLQAALANFMDPETSLLASISERFENPYDGLSRCSELLG